MYLSQKEQKVSLFTNHMFGLLYWELPRKAIVTNQWFCQYITCHKSKFDPKNQHRFCCRVSIDIISEWSTFTNNVEDNGVLTPFWVVNLQRKRWSEFRRKMSIVFVSWELVYHKDCCKDFLSIGLIHTTTLIHKSVFVSNLPSKSCISKNQTYNNEYLKVVYFRIL